MLGGLWVLLLWGLFTGNGSAIGAAVVLAVVSAVAIVRESMRSGTCQ